MERQTETEAGKWRDRQKQRPVNGETDRNRGRLMERQTDRQKQRPVNGETDRNRGR